jgi:hypothetical protein
MPAKFAAFVTASNYKQHQLSMSSTSQLGLAAWHPKWDAQSGLNPLSHTLSCSENFFAHVLEPVMALRAADPVPRIPDRAVTDYPS